MVIMDIRYSEDHQQQLFHKIHTLHLSYLDTEESPEKIETRLKLESCIREFLCMTPPNEKFYIPETAEVLYRSASKKADFSGYKAATGFNAIQLYAGNILSQPWRKEYRQIKTYSGFYKHQIEANLIDAEFLFRAMGYKHLGNGILILDGPICPDKATSISRDCLVAYVECQILKTIWEELSTIINLSWLDVLELRAKYYCSPEQTIKIVKYEYSQKKYHEVLSNSCPDGIIDRNHCQPRENITPQNYLSNSYLVHGINDIGVPYAPIVNQKYSYDMNGCCVNNAVPFTVMHPTSTYSIPVNIPEPPVNNYYSNGYCYPNNYMQSKACPVHNSYNAAYHHSVPTAELIRLGSQNSYDSVDSPSHPKLLKQNSLQSGVYNEAYRKKSSDDSQAKGSDRESVFEDWDYVYRNLESQGYSKDLGERGNILNSVPNPKASKQMSTDPAKKHPLQKENVYSQPNKPDNYSKINIKQSSSLDDPRTREARKVQTKSSLSLPGKPQRTLSNSETPKLIDLGEPKKESKTEKVTREGINGESLKWQCKFCTFLNETKRDICEMCSKSKVTIEQTMEIGGTECSQCTLVNPKNRKTCDACSNSLKNSPTYI